MEDLITVTCWNENNSTSLVDEKVYCPKCNMYSEIVNSSVVKHFVLDGFKDSVNNEDYYICLDKDCHVAYFNGANDQIFTIADIKTPIYFKKQANPKYICYCNNVTEKEIIDSVLTQGAKNMKDIIRITGAMKNANCEVNNPLGKCCSPIIKETINKALKLKDDI